MIDRAIFNLFEALGIGIIGPPQLEHSTILLKQINRVVIDKKKSR
jgi:hypothetical protein